MCPSQVLAMSSTQGVTSADVVFIPPQSIIILKEVTPFFWNWTRKQSPTDPVLYILTMMESTAAEGSAGVAGWGAVFVFAEVVVGLRDFILPGIVGDFRFVKLGKKFAPLWRVCRDAHFIGEVPVGAIVLHVEPGIIKC